MHNLEDLLAMHAEEQEDLLQWYRDQGDRDSERLAAVLDIHYPTISINRIVCAECETQLWPCNTYRSMRAI